MPKTQNGLDQSVIDAFELKGDEIILARLSSSAPMAKAIVATDAGEWPDDLDALADMLNVNRTAETSALKKWLKLRQTIGRKLAGAQEDYHSLRKRTLRLTDRIAGDFPTVAVQTAETGDKEPG